MELKWAVECREHLLLQVSLLVLPNRELDCQFQLAAPIHQRLVLAMPMEPQGAQLGRDFQSVGRLVTLFQMAANLR